MTQLVAYLRVSTARQGRSGLGLEAQRMAVAGYVAAGRGELIGEYVEVESGRALRRPQLAAALDACRRRRAVLLVAKLDRLGRRLVELLVALDGDVPVAFADLPDVPAGPAGRLLTGMVALVAEYEAGLISERTRAALAVAKARGVKLGNPRPAEAQKRATVKAAGQAAEFRATMAPLIRQLQADGLGVRAIARELNRRGVKTLRGREWQGAQVLGVLHAS